MEIETGTHREILENMRQCIFDLLDDYNTKENIDKDKLLYSILGYIMDLNAILDNHEARLKLIEKCLNKVKQTYFDINLDD